MCILSGVGLLAVGFARFRKQSERMAQMKKNGVMKKE